MLVAIVVLDCFTFKTTVLHIEIRLNFAKKMVFITIYAKISALELIELLYYVPYVYEDKEWITTAYDLKYKQTITHLHSVQLHPHSYSYGIVRDKTTDCTNGFLTHWVQYGQWPFHFSIAGSYILVYM